MRGAIITCTLLLTASCANLVIGQENPRRPTYVYVAGKTEASSSYWPSWKMPNLWPTGLGTRIASGTKSSWSAVQTGSSRAWYSTQYTLAPWSKPKPQALTGSRGMSSSKPKAKAKSGEESASWWPKLDFWNSGEKEEKLKKVEDWQMLSSPAAGFDE